MQAITITQITPPELEALLEKTFQKVLSEHNQVENTVEDEILTIKQAAVLLTLSVATIYGLVSRSEIPVNKRGKRLYFSKTELMEWVKAGRKRTNVEVAEEAAKYLNKRR